jgi:hypothetical protein
MTAPMPNSRSAGFTLPAIPIAPVAILLNCVFSVLVILQNPLLNDDAYKYLRAAELYNSSGALAVLKTYEWFNYSILIALVDHVLPGGHLAAAHILNTGFGALLTWSFIRLSRELRDSRRVQFFAAACILLFPLINEMRYFLIRDTGFWAFAVLSLVLLMRFRATGEMHRALCWCLALCAATAFRLEGLLLMLAAPLSLLLSDGALALTERGRRCVTLLGVLAAVLIGILGLTLLAGASLVDLIAFAYRHYLPLLADPFAQFTDTAAGTPDNVAVVLFNDARALLLDLVNALSVPVVVLLLVHRWLHGPLALPQAKRRALMAYMASAALPLLLFVLIMHFMTQRYATLLSLLLLSLVPLMLDDLYTLARRHGKLRRFHAVAGFYCFYYFVDSFVSFGYSHRHIEEGIVWTREQLPADAVVRTNDFAIAYHSGRVADYDQIVRNTDSVIQASAPGDYLVLELGHNDNSAVLDANPVLQPLQLFTNERGDEVRVYLHR